ncbi:ATP-binding cassette domain-containing protein [Amycolatopsis sp. NPDC049868]|uniref:ATP-binding cassette domain-containing protein n=1 Tax=Amycolatopsis sp. NPDC049868 TaxID=3363934 RepID=UPI0037AB3967
MSSMIEVRGLVKKFGRTVALDGVDLAVRTGTVIGVLGPNGAGKTTMVRILATLLRPDAGSATVAGFDVVADPVPVRGLIGLTGQYASVDGDLTGTENLLLIGRLSGLSSSVARRRATELLERFGIGEIASRAAGTYSGGQRRRLDLAASLIGEPRVLCLDEPTTGLDPYVRWELWKVVRGLVADGVTAVLTTQYLEEADRLADRITVLDQGQVVAEGTADELKRRVGGQTVQVRPSVPSDRGAVARTMEKVAGTAPSADPATGMLSASLNDPVLLSTLVRRLDQAGLTVDELALRLPSLDEVFLALTGSRAERQLPEGSKV